MAKIHQKKNFDLHCIGFLCVVTIRKFTPKKQKHKYKIETYKYKDPSKYNNFSQCFMASENTRSPWQSIPHQWPSCLPLANSPATECRLPWNWFSSFHCMVPLLPHLPLSFVNVDVAIPQSCNRPQPAAEIRDVIQRTTENPDFPTLLMQIWLLRYSRFK
jgi:hypothetical protein